MQAFELRLSRTEEVRRSLILVLIHQLIHIKGSMTGSHYDLLLFRY